MIRNKTTITETRGHHFGKVLAFFLAGILITVFLADSDVLGDPIKAHGILNSIENDGVVMIDNKGYKLSPSLTVRNYQGNKITLRELPSSCLVEFEYEYEPRGFVIIFMQEVPQ